VLLVTWCSQGVVLWTVLHEKDVECFGE
jgi:hypothetical protein